MMKCNLSLCGTFITILWTSILLIEVSCSNNCSDILFDIHTLYPPDFERHPCYIQWKADKEANRQQQAWNRRDEIEKQIARDKEIEEENWRRERDDTLNTYYFEGEVRKKSAVGTIVLSMVGVIIALCLIGACILFCRKDKTPLPNTNNHRSPGLTGVSTTSRVSNAPMPEQVSLPHQSGTNAQFLPRGVINRQNSLPSYDDVMRTPSAPPNV